MNNESILTLPSHILPRSNHFITVPKKYPSYNLRNMSGFRIGDVVKTVSISRTRKRIYEMSPSLNLTWPIQMLCDTQIKNERRRIILSSIVRIYNNTTLPLLVLNVDSTDIKKHSRVARLEINQDYYVPMDLLYAYTSSPIFIAVDEGEEVNDFFSFDWDKEFSTERIIKLKSGNQANFTVKILSTNFQFVIFIYLKVFKELTDAYSENTDQINRTSFNLYIHPALHLTNLLPIDIECSIDNVEQFALKPSQLYLVTSGSRSSSLLFTIPSYDNIKWISEPVDLKVEGKGDFNEHIVIFRNKAASNPQQILRMVLRVDTFHESYRLLFYSSLWILNRTDLKLEFQIENNRTFIDVIERPHLVCPEKIGSEANKKGQICVYGVDQGDAAAKWSEKFSLGVIKSTGLTSCRVPNDQIYMICVDIATSSFGLTKLVTLSPAMVVINKSTVGIEVVETVSNEEQGKWETINPEQLIPFWPRNIKESVMRVRYTHNQITSSPFNMNQKHRTLLRMEDEECPAIYVEVAATDFDSVKVIFEDYKIGDAPLLIVNSLENEPVSFCQVNDVRTQILPPSNYVYYTWTDPILPRELTVSCGSKSEKIGFTVRGVNVPAAPSLKIDADLEEFRIILASKQAKLFDIQVQGVKAYVSQAPEKTLVNLILSDLCILDPYKDARYRKIISQQGDDKELLRVDLSLFNYPEGYQKAIDVFDCDVKVQFAKANIVFLFKHIDAILGFLDSLNITKAALNIASTQADAAYEQVQKLQEQAFKVHLDITFNAPNIIIPTNSYSDQALFLDLGKLILKTNFYDDPRKSLVEQQNIRFENMLASRVKLDRDCNILGEAILLECAELNTLINRLLYPDKVKTEPGVSIKVDWKLVHFQLAKDDYSCVMRVLMENFSENIRDQIPEGFQNEQYRYRQEAQEKEEEKLRAAVIKKQKESCGTEVLPTLKLRAEIKKLALTLYLGESDMSVRRGPRNDNLKLANVQIDTFEALFRQRSDGSYKATARVKNFLLDDLRATNKSSSVTRMMDRHFTVDPNTHMFVASFEFNPKNQSRPTALRQLTAQLESLYISISLDYLMILQDFFISGLPSGNAETPRQVEQQAITTTEQSNNDQNRTKMDKKPTPVTSKTSVAPSKPTTTQTTTASNADTELETRIDVSVKNPEIILLEDQHNSNSNCLVLDLALQLRMITIGTNTQLYGWLKNLTVYSSNFAELRESNNSGSKIKYRILQPAKADIYLTMDNEQQKIDVRISDIIVSIAPAAIRTLIGVTSSLGTLQAATKEETEKLNSKSLFNPKPIKDGHFWFTKDYEKKSQQTDESETARDTSSQQTVVKEKEEIQKPLIQQLILILETIEVKLEVGLGSVTKSVVAMCLSNLTADVQNWSSNMSLASTVNVEAALYNENMLSWEPLIEPTIASEGARISPWCITCSILPALPLTEKTESSVIDAQERKEDVSSSKSKQIILVRADQLLNITITKTGLGLVQRLSALFNDVYNKRLPPSDDDDQPLLSLCNETGRELFIDNLDGLQFAIDSSLKSITLQTNQSIPLNVANEHQTAGRLSVIDEQTFKKRQEFSVKIGDVVKTVSTSRTWKRVYELGPSLNARWPIQMLCDAQIKNERRRIILSSVVRVYNNTTLPLLILNVDSTDPRKHSRIARIEVNQDYHVPIDLLYAYASSPIFIAIDEGEEVNDFFSFDWDKEFSTERMLKLKNGNQANFIVFKELVDAYSENTDVLNQTSFNLHIHPALHLTNLLPINIECSIDNVEQFTLQPSQLYLVTSGGRNASLVFTIPSYDNIKWISKPIDLKVEGKGDHNEHMVIFCNDAVSDPQQILRMVLRVDAFHESYRLLLYSPLWILNRTDLKLEFQIENNRTFIDVIERPHLVCPEKIGSEANKKGQICVYGIGQSDTTAKWSEKFSLDVIKSTGLTSCKVPNDRTYMICVDIATSSFGLTKLVTLSPAMVIINKSTIGIEIIETVSNEEQGKWETINPEQLIPFWPRNIKDSLMCVRYAHNKITSSPFKMNQKHRTLLRIDDEERPAIYVEVAATDFDGVKVIFGDYKIGDAPLLIINYLENDPVSFCQTSDVRTQILPPSNYVYYTWIDPLLPRALTISCGSKTAKVELTPQRIALGQEGQSNVTYTVFIDGIQTVLLFSDEEKAKESASKIPSVAESMDQHIQIGIHDIGISIVNDLTREEMFYISLNKSKVVWTEIKKNRTKPLSRSINTYLEELYTTHVEQCEMNPDDKELQRKKYQMEGFREISFHGDKAELIHSKSQQKIAKRQALDGLWIEYAWSASNSAIHLRINRVQIDNQLDYTIFPVMLHPSVSKGTGSDYVEKPFIELSVYQSKTAQSNIMQFKYFKVLIQEFAVQIDQGLIVAILNFLKPDNVTAAPAINMNTDLEQIQKPLHDIINAQIESPSGETEMFFDNIHLSPLKIHVSFSMHGSNPSEELLAEYPLVGFLLQTLNVAEVQDVILRLGYYERKNEKFTTTKITNEVSSHYQNQFMKQLHVLVLGLDVLGNPLGVIRGLAEGVESFFYEPYKGAIEGPLEFAEGVATGFKALFGSAVGGAAGAASKITSVFGKGLASLTFDEDYKISRIRRKEPGVTATTHIAIGGKNVVMGFVDGVKGVVTKPIRGAKHGGASGFFKGLGQGVVGLVARPTGGIVDFASTSLDLIKRTAQQEEIVRRVRYPRHVGRDGVVRPYVAHEAMGFYILNRLEDGNYAKSDTYVAHITCSDSPLSWLMATSKRLLFVTEISFLGLYEIDWEILYEDLKEEPTIKINTNQIQILTKEPKSTGTMKSHQSFGKLVKFKTISNAKYIVDKIGSAMHIAGL
ncbi:unnamed protein product [Rotaria sp. Silwood2]|nr:unnamed protein product [Rotaria sp. Silwood2]